MYVTWKLRTYLWLDLQTDGSTLSILEFSDEQCSQNRLEHHGRNFPSPWQTDDLEAGGDCEAIPLPQSEAIPQQNWTIACGWIHVVGRDIVACLFSRDWEVGLFYLVTYLFPLTLVILKWDFGWRLLLIKSNDHFCGFLLYYTRKIRSKIELYYENDCILFIIFYNLMRWDEMMAKLILVSLFLITTMYVLLSSQVSNTCSQKITQQTFSLTSSSSLNNFVFSLISTIFTQ